MRAGLWAKAGFFLFILFAISFLVSAAWIESGVKPGMVAGFLAKLTIINGAGAALALLIVSQVRHRIGTALVGLERFASAQSAAEGDLPEASVHELPGLAHSLLDMAQHAQRMTGQGRLELARREAILSCMAEGVLAVDDELRVTFCNNAFSTMFEIRITHVEGRSFYEVVREPIVRDILQQVLRTGNSETDRVQLPSAAGRWFEARALPFRDRGERGAVVVFHDVTDLERQEQLRKDFVADVSHELRTPLAAIRGYAETLLDGALDDSEHNRKFVDVIQSHAIRLNHIASDLLVISELGSRTAPAGTAERISLLEVVESAMHTVQANAASRGILLDASGCKECNVVGYRFRLEQALTNLLDNTVKFNKPEGRVLIECEPICEGQIQLTIADTGIGIPSDQLKRIFERFYRVDKARSRPAGGTGLGLPIVKEVVESMGGTISVESQLGRGSKFTILMKAA